MAISRRDVLTMAIAGGIGVVSGGLSYYVHIETYRPSIDQRDAVVLWLTFLGPGIIFGVAIGLYLVRMGVTSILRATAFVPLVTAAWYAAYWFAVVAEVKLGLPLAERWQLGIASGLIGASLVALSALLLFPFFRRWNLVVAMIVAGGAAGVLLSAGGKESARFLLSTVWLFTVWQGAVAACFGWAVARARGTS